MKLRRGRMMMMMKTIVTSDLKFLYLISQAKVHFVGMPKKAWQGDVRNHVNRTLLTCKPLRVHITMYRNHVKR